MQDEVTVTHVGGIPIGLPEMVREYLRRKSVSSSFATLYENVPVGLKFVPGQRQEQGHKQTQHGKDKRKEQTGIITKKQL